MFEYLIPLLFLTTLKKGKNMNYQKLSALTLAFLITPAFAQNSIKVEEPYSRITAPTVKMGAAFMEITNNSEKDDVLIAAQADVSKTIELHKTTINDEGVMKMREMKDGIPLPAGKTVTLKPGGLHIMLMGLKAPLKLNDTYKMTLKFKNAPEKTIKIEVNNGKVTDSHMDHGAHDHSAHDHSAHDHSAH